MARRVLQGAGVLTIIVFFTYGAERALRPDSYPGQAYWPHVWHASERAVFHLDFGRACGWAGCPHIHDMWVHGIAADLCLVAGALLIAVCVGVLGAVVCARRPRSLPSRVLQAGATLAYCSPVYVLGLGLVLLFNADAGKWPIPYFFDIRPAAYVSPLSNPWDWARSFAIPWLVLAAPLAGACLRITLAMTVEELDRDHVRTAVAKGLSRSRVLRRHAAPGAYVSLTAYLWATIPAFVTNAVLVEWVFNVPGFFVNARRALGQDPFHVEVLHEKVIDIPMVEALALWSAVLIIVMSVLADVTSAAIDPRIRLGARFARS